MKKKQKLKERICALVLALAMVLTWVLPDAGMTVQAAGGTEVEYTVSVTDEDGALADVSVSAQTGDTAAVTAKTGQNGKATLTLTKDAEYTVTLAKEGYETHTANVTPTEQNTQMNQKLRFKPFTITASDSTIAGQNVTLQIANPVAGVSYQWTANGASAAPTSGTGTSFNITCAAAGTVNVTAAAKGQTASKSIIVNKKTINTSDISISLDPDQGAVNKISVTVAGFPADAEGQVTLQYSYQGSTYTKTASKTKDITSVVIVLNAEQDVFFGKLNCTVSYANDALYNDFSGVNKDAVYRKTHELTSEQKIELDTDNDGKKEEVYGQEITYGECIDKTVELKAEDVKDRVVTYSFDENDTESQNIVTISEDGKISLKEDGHSGTAKVIVKAAETDDYAAAQMEYYIVAKPKAITVDVSKNLTVKDASKVYDGSADITVGAVVDGTLLVNGDDGTNAEKDVLEIEGVKGTLWNTTEDDADPSTVKIILITSASGGVGKTSVAFGLCRCLERNYKKTLYVNADRLQSFQWMMENSEPIRDASVYAGLSGNLGNVYRIVRHVIRKEGFSYLPPFKAALMSLGIPYRVFALLAEAARKEQEYDYIVIDADSVFDEEKAALMQLADKILIVTKQTEYAVKATNELIQNVNRNNSDKYIFLCNDFKKEEENALLLPTAAHRFTVSEYIEHLPAYEMKGSGLPVQTPGLQKAAFLIM